MKLITVLHSRDRHFNICQADDGHYWSIEDTLLDKQGKLAHPINGLQGLRSQDINCTIRWTLDRVETEHLESLGWDTLDATLWIYLSRETNQTEAMTAKLDELRAKYNVQEALL